MQERSFFHFSSINVVYITSIAGCVFLLRRSHNSLWVLFNLSSMDWQHLYQKQLDENQELKKQLDIAESILREYLPIVENNDEQN